MEIKSERRSRLSKGVFVIPSLFTAAALFSGFYAIIYTINSILLGRSDIEPAVNAIFMAAIFDSLDGRMARLMKAESDFGFQFDSIADMVSFGVAPSILVYSAALHPLGRVGWLGAFLYLACAAIRLARFNVISTSAPSRKYFKGMPSPVAAVGLSVATFLFQGELSFEIFGSAMLGVSILTAGLMVSNVRFRSFKEMHFSQHKIQVFLIAILIAVSIFTFRELAVFVLFVGYLVSGIVEEIVLFRRRRKSDPSVPFLPFGDREI